MNIHVDIFIYLPCDRQLYNILTGFPLKCMALTMEHL